MGGSGLAAAPNAGPPDAGEDAVLEKIGAFQDCVIDGHSPALGGRGLQTYIAAGVLTQIEARAKVLEDTLIAHVALTAPESAVIKPSIRAMSRCS